MATYLIVGGSSGIGRQLSEQLAEAGHEVYATYNETEKSEENRSGIQYHHCNVLEEIDFQYLPESLDGVVYCAGNINLKPFKSITPESFNEDYKLQVVGAVKVIQEVLPNLKKAEQPSIILFSTVAVQQGLNYHSQVASSKGAVEGLARALAAEFAPEIRVNCIAPSLTDTPMASSLLNSDKKREANADRHPLKRIGTARDIANMAEFLLSGRSGWITGQVMHVDGGLSSLNI
ncbi:MAG: SDR family oxidoreductase [Balneolaceae bacterium]|nr:SDR family oxidoreductase [Balneolaceae bacterium]